VNPQHLLNVVFSVSPDVFNVGLVAQQPVDHAVVG